jgi:hypothetical protein
VRTKLRRFVRKKRGHPGDVRLNNVEVEEETGRIEVGDFHLRSLCCQRAIAQPGARMHATMVTFTFAQMDAGAMARLQEERASLYDATAGLISKTFWLDSTANQCGAFYLWDGPESAEALFTASWRARVLAVYGAQSMEIRPLEVTARSGR